MSEAEEGRRIRQGAVRGAVGGLLTGEVVNVLANADLDVLRFMTDGVCAAAGAIGGIAINHMVGEYKARRAARG